MEINKLNLNDTIYQSKTKSTKQEANQFKEMLEKAQQSENSEDLKSACKQFESIFTNILLKNMRRTVGDGGLTEKSQAREMFEEMLDEKIAEEVSKGQGIGLAQTIYEQLSKNISVKVENTDE